MGFTLSFKIRRPSLFKQIRAETKKVAGDRLPATSKPLGFASLWPARNSGFDYAVNELPQPQLRAALGF